MVDAHGTTTYTYDARDRLTSKASPEGALTFAVYRNGYVDPLSLLPPR